MPSDELRERLLHLFNGDHKRGCEGRTYSCDCGYDPDVLRALKDAAAALEAAALDAQGAQWQPTHRHVKSGGLYRVIGDATVEADLTRVVVYESHKGKLWTRPALEFHDGRFEELPAAPQPSTGR